MNRRAQAVAALLTLTTVVAAQPAGHAATAGDDHPELRTVLERLTGEGGAPGALAEVGDGPGRTVLTSGVGDVRTGAPVPRRGRFRIGSVTKTFVATVVLQLAGERRVALDAPVEDYLPGLIRGEAATGGRSRYGNCCSTPAGCPTTSPT